MNNNHEKDQLRFDKLYKLLGDEVNSIYEPSADNQIFVDNATAFNDNESNKSESIQELNDVISEYNNSVANNSNNINQVSNNDNNINQVSNNDNNFKDVFNIFNKKEEVHNSLENVVAKNDESTLNTSKEIINDSVKVASVVQEPQAINVNHEINLSNNKLNDVNNQTSRRDIYHNKTIISGADYLEDETNNEYISWKKSLKELLTNKKFIMIVSILAFICVCIVVAKAFYFGKKVDQYEEIFTEITYKEDTAAKVYDDKEVDSAVLKKMAASKLIDCISAPVDMNNLPSSITTIINELNNYYNSSYNYFAFAYKDIFTGFTVSYNANQNIFTASTIKGPTDIYIYEMASQGKIDLEEILTYTSNYYNTGSGLLKSKPFNTKYSVRKLLEYSTVNSDNAAHNMLMDKYGRENMRKFWADLGATAIFTQNSNWGVTNAHDAMIYMSELYNFYANNDKYGEEVMNNFIKSSPIFLKGDGNNLVANKFGWSGTAIHDVAIIFDENPYIAVALSNLGVSDYSGYFYNANLFAKRLHEEYWKYKMNTCGNIKQY